MNNLRLSVSYEPVTTHLKSINSGRNKQHRFEFTSGQVNVLVGESGIGKTTFVENLLGVSLFSQKIACHFDGVSIEAPDIRKIASYCPQYPAQINGDAIENISLGMPFQVNLINELIEKLRLGHLSMESSGSNMEVVWSGGEKMRIGLARAILLGRQINIFDEPLAPLDPENKIIVSKLLSDLSKTSIVLCITHEKNVGLGQVKYHYFQ